RWGRGSTRPATWRCSPTRTAATTTWPPTCASAVSCELVPGTELPQGLARASAILDIRRFDEASALPARVVSAEPGGAPGWGPEAGCMMARAHVGTDRYTEGATAANGAVARDPADEWSHRLASNALVHLGRHADALRAAHEACRLAPGYWQTHVCVAQAALAA